MGVLYIVATPIGNLEDITVRAVKTLLSATVIVCEDTRRTGQLLQILRERYREFDLGIKPKLISVRDWNEAQSVELVLRELAAADVALVSDAGTPLISDPGFKVVRAARELGIEVSPIPGPNAALAALSAAGLPTNKFLFWGFLPKKWELVPEMTHVIYEAPARAEKTVNDINSKYPEAQIVVTQELTKVHEKVARWQEGMKFKGEVTLVVYLPKVREEVSAGHGDGNGDAHDGKKGGGDIG